MMSVNSAARFSSCSFALVLLAPTLAAASQQDSTPAEQAQTQQLNQNITNTNAAADAESVRATAAYQAQQARYREQLAAFKAGQANYEEQSMHYEAARDRYVAGHARYHRAVWPMRFDHRLIADTNDLLGANVHTTDGYMIGHVTEIALTTGQVDALRVTLDHDRGDVWIETADLRFNADQKIVMTNLDRWDLYEMTRETY